MVIVLLLLLLVSLLSGARRKPQEELRLALGPCLSLCYIILVYIILQDVTLYSIILHYIRLPDRGTGYRDCLNPIPSSPLILLSVLERARERERERGRERERPSGSGAGLRLRAPPVAAFGFGRRPAARRPAGHDRLGWTRSRNSPAALVCTAF